MAPFSAPVRALSTLAIPSLLLAIGCGGAVYESPGTGGGATTAGAGAGGSTTASSTGAGGGGGTSPCSVTPWAKRYGDAEDQLGLAIAVDGACNLFVAASVTSGVDFGNGTLQGTKFYTGSTLAKLDETGQVVWSRWLESSTSGVGISALAVDLEGNLLMTGVFPGTFDFGAGPVAAGAEGDAYVTKLDTTGKALWVRTWSATGGFNHHASHLAVDASGDVVLTGAFNGTADFGEGPVKSLGEDIFVLKLDASGATRWSKRFGGPGNTLDQVASVAVGPKREIVMAGRYQGVLDFGAGPLPQSYGAAFLVMLDDAGTALWSKPIPGTSCGYNVCPVRVAVAPSGDVVVVGTKSVDPSDPDKLPGLFRSVLPSNGDAGISHDLAGLFVNGIAREAKGEWLLAGSLGARMVSRIDASGNPVWSSGVLTPEYMNDHSSGATGIALDPAGNVLVVGTFSGALDFGTGVLTSAGKRDVFVAKLSAF